MIFPLTQAIKCKVTKGNCKHIFVQHCISSKKYNVFIRYIPNSNSIDGIKGWTSNCQNGLRTVGCCVHVCSVVYYLSYLRYQNEIFEPARHFMSLFQKGQAVLNDDSDED